MTTVVIVDDHPVVSAGIRSVLNITGDISVLAEGTRGADALRLVAEYRPDVLILDVNLPDLNGLERVPRLKTLAPNRRVFLVSVFGDAADTFRSAARAAGAEVFISNDELSLELVSM